MKIHNRSQNRTVKSELGLVTLVHGAAEPVQLAKREGRRDEFSAEFGAKFESGDF